MRQLATTPGVFYCNHPVVQLREALLFFRKEMATFCFRKELAPGMCNVNVPWPGIIIGLLLNVPGMAWLFPLSNGIAPCFEMTNLVCIVANFYLILCRMAEGGLAFLFLWRTERLFTLWTSLWAIQKGNCAAVDVEIFNFLAEKLFMAQSSAGG